MSGSKKVQVTTAMTWHGHPIAGATGEIIHRTSGGGKPVIVVRLDRTAWCVPLAPGDVRKVATR